MATNLHHQVRCHSLLVVLLTRTFFSPVLVHEWKKNGPNDEGANERIKNVHPLKIPPNEKTV